MPTQMATRSVPSLGRSVTQSIFGKLHPVVGRPAQTFAMWCARSAERRALRELAEQPHLLKDIGLSREQALREAEKLFWRP